MLLLTSVLPTAAARRPMRAVGEQVANGHRQKVVGVHQPAEGVTMRPIRVGVVRECNLVLILETTSRAIA